MVKKDCKDEEILKYIEGELSERDARILNNKLKSNPDCKRAYDFYNNLENGLIKMSEFIEVPKGFSSKVMSRLEKYGRKKLFEIKEVFISIGIFIGLFILFFLLKVENNNFINGVFKGLLISVKSLLLLVIKFLHIVFLSIYNLLYSFVLLGKGLGNVFLNNISIIIIPAFFLVLFFLFKYKRTLLSGIKKK